MVYIVDRSLKVSCEILESCDGLPFVRVSFVVRLCHGLIRLVSMLVARGRDRWSGE